MDIDFKNSAMLSQLAREWKNHSPESTFYIETKDSLTCQANDLEAWMRSEIPICLGGSVSFIFPYYSFGSISSVDLLSLDELILMAFYWRNRSRYNRVIDIGANIGLHSIVLDQMGYSVDCYEPDHNTFQRLEVNLLLNLASNVTAFQKAVSTHQGTASFIRVKGNTTSSHLEGAKQSAYGILEQFSVDTIGAQEAAKDADLLKIDAEGHEAAICASIGHEQWERIDAVIEVGTQHNAQLIWAYFERCPSISIYCQRSGWDKALSAADLPSSYRDGSIFVSARNHPWV
jgi:FkbM family methyltransferase